MRLEIDFTGSVDNYSLEKLKSYIHERNEAAKISDLRLNIQSLGGSVSGAVAIYNYLKALPFPVQTHNLGEVTSAAILVYLGGTARTAEYHSKFTIHPIQFSLNGNYSYYQIREIADTLDADIRLYASVVNEETNALNGIYNIEELLKGKSVTLSPEAAHKCGIITN